jgi:hypothetical protein
MVYLAIPIDLVPDFVPVLGYADDAIIVTLVLRSVVRRAGLGAVRHHWPGTDDCFAAPQPPDRADDPRRWPIQWADPAVSLIIVKPVVKVTGAAALSVQMVPFSQHAEHPRRSPASQWPTSSGRRMMASSGVPWAWPSVANLDRTERPANKPSRPTAAARRLIMSATARSLRRVDRMICTLVPSANRSSLRLLGGSPSRSDALATAWSNIS